MVSNAQPMRSESPDSLLARFKVLRPFTVGLTGGLLAEDTVLQSVPDVSPTKWHLAHVTWFFEHFILEPHISEYRRYDDDFDFLFNS